jgi:hypothetical protein
MTNDIMKVNYYLAKSLIQNNNEILTEEDTEIIFE